MCALLGLNPEPAGTLMEVSVGSFHPSCRIKNSQREVQPSDACCFLPGVHPRWGYHLFKILYEINEK